jgi:hypothetical protein
MNRDWKIIIPRVSGDEPIFNNIVLHGINSLKFPVRVFNCVDDVTEPNTISHKYARGIKALKNNELKDDDIIILSHNDTNFLDNHFREKVELVFSEKDIALLGFVGTKELKESACWWENSSNNLRGHLIQGSKDKSPGDGFHLIKGLVGYFDDLVAVDGMCLITLGKYLRAGGIEIDTQTYVGNHFYDLDLCMSFLTKGFKIGVADILVYHKSEGKSNENEEWKTERDKFIAKWKNKGIEFPVTYESIKAWREKNNVITPDINKQSEIIEIEI